MGTSAHKEPTSWITASWLLMSAVYLTLGTAAVDSALSWVGFSLVAVVSWLAAFVAWQRHAMTDYPVGVILVGTAAYLAATALGSLTPATAIAAFSFGFVALAWLRPWYFASLYGGLVASVLVGNLVPENTVTYWDLPFLVGLMPAGAYGIQWARKELVAARQDASTDPLTGLKNRRELPPAMAEMQHQAARRGHRIAALTIDLDHFKQINDDYGHATGDTLLVKVAQVLKLNARSSDLVARVGGEEFVILAVVPHHAAAVDLAERIREAVALVDSPRPVTASVGVAVAEQDRESVHALMQRADIAMYAAKEAGRNAVRTAG